MLIGISLISFFIMHLAPGDITSSEAAFNPKASEESRQKLRELYNLDKPVITQYGLWLKRMVELDFGNSFQESLPITLLINLIGIFLIFSVSIVLGTISAVKQNSIVDKSITFFIFVAFAIPGFWLALLLMYWTGVVNQWLPISGLHSLDYKSFSEIGQFFDLLKHLILPVSISMLSGLAGISLYVRNGMLDVLHQDFITTARSKGLNEKNVIFTHALKNAILPLITIVGLSIPGLIGGSVIAESIFAIPGMGKLFYDSVLMRDFPVIMGILTIGSVLTLIGTLIADIGYAWADPRIRKGLVK